MIEFKILDRATGVVIQTGRAESLRDVEDSHLYDGEKHILIYMQPSDDPEKKSAYYGILPSHH